MRWAPLEPSNDFKAFLALNRARSVEACHEAIAAFNWPDQNFLCADSKNIGLWHNGQYPIRWKGQGRTVSDGTNRDYDWLGWLPRDQVPGSLNPERGFLSSANQAPTDSSYPHYLGWPFEEPYRALRINEALRAKSKFSPADIAAIQGDVEHRLARDVLPVLLQALPERTAMSERQRAMVEALSKWNFRFDEDSSGAAIFATWWTHLEDAIWSEKFPDRAAYAYPPVWRTVQLIKEDPKSKHFDQLSTPNRETLGDRAWSSFQAAETELAEKLGSAPSSWAWATLRPTNFPHAAKIPGLGHPPMRVRGEKFNVYANTGSHGPVWKLVVALGTGVPGPDSAPKAWAIYPGGQSGNPASPLYDSFLDRWSRNELRELAFLPNAEAPLPGAVATVALRGALPGEESDGARGDHRAKEGK